MNYFNRINGRLDGAAWTSSIESLDEQIASILARMPGAFDFAQEAPKGARWRESAGAYLARLDLPGLKASDIVLELHGDEIAVSAEHKESTGQGADKTDRVYCYRRRVPVPEGTDTDKISAIYRDGALSVTLPKADQAKRRVIQVQGE